MDSVGSINLFCSIALVVIVFIFLTRMVLNRISKDFKAPLSEATPYIEALFSAPDESYLIVTEQNSNGFIQFLKQPGGVLIDFPTTGEPNHGKKPAFTAASQRHGLPLNAERDTLQAQFTGNAEELSALLRQLMAETFGVNDNTVAEYDWDGFKGPIKK